MQVFNLTTKNGFIIVSYNNGIDDIFDEVIPLTEYEHWLVATDQLTEVYSVYNQFTNATKDYEHKVNLHHALGEPDWHLVERFLKYKEHKSSSTGASD